MKKISKKAKLISLASIGIAATSVVTTSATGLLMEQKETVNVNNDLSNDLNQNVTGNVNNKPVTDTTNNNIQQTKPLIPSASNYFNAKLSSVNGPILFWDNKITSADWFGAERWNIDLLTANHNGIKFSINPEGHKGWKRTWLNWDLDKKNNILYVLSSWGRVGTGGKDNKGVPQQNVIAIDVTTGKIIKIYELKDLGVDAFYALSVLDDGNVLVFAKQGHAISENILINTKDHSHRTSTGNLDKISVRPTGYDSSTNYLMNLIPIGPNRNLAVTYNMTSHSGTDNDDGADKGTSQVEFILCDDNMKTIEQAEKEWSKPVLVTEAIKNTKNSAIWPQRDWYKLIDGRVVTVIYDKLIVINPKNLNNPLLEVHTLDKDKWVESWSFDTNENLFYKNRDETKIKKVTLSKNNAISISEYYDLNNDPINEIKINGSSFNLYNVYGYAGQIMLVNTWFSKWINSDEYPDKKENHPDKDKMKFYGLAAAITDNKNSSGNGDTKGLLNTDKAFQKSADFNIEENILKNKLPSEITRNDLSFTEKGFLTKNKTMENGQLKYPPFVKTKMDDSTKELEVEAHIDQIPWFVGDNKMPENIPPLKITKKFKSEVEIKNRYWWKNATDDYDFANTLPSKLTVDDIKRINPFIVDITSQKAKIGSDNYPKLTYSKVQENDNDGKIKIKAEYKYLPMDVPVNANNLKTITEEKEYQIFKKTDTKNFAFIGGNTTDINQINELKELKEADVLASVFKNTSDKQEFIKFIDVNNTKGYPLSKMDISVTANDAKGELIINVDPTKYDSTLTKQTKTFTGFNKNNEYSLSFENNKSTFNKKSYRPSDVSEEIFFDNFIKYTGFDSTDLHLELFADDDKGILNASLNLITDYPEETLKNTPFKKNDANQWVAKSQISGFKTTDEFNKDYQLIFKKDNDSSLMKIKESTPSEIVSAFSGNNKNNVVINGNYYKDKHEFVKKEFVESMGLKMPPLEQNNNIEIDLFANNSGGELTVKVVFKNVPGYNIPLTFIQIFTGFAKGNDVVTQDVLVLKNQMQLENTMEKVLKAYPSQVKEHLLKTKSDIKHFFTTEPTGDYKKAIDDNKFELVISEDDIYGELIITIKFNRDDIKDPKSLLEYSQFYKNFKHY